MSTNIKRGSIHPLRVYCKCEHVNRINLLRTPDVSSAHVVVTHYHIRFLSTCALSIGVECWRWGTG